jgi:hypothetical protein
MSDEIAALHQRERGYSFVFSAFAIPAARAEKIARLVRNSSTITRICSPFVPLLFFGYAIQRLWFAWHSDIWSYFWWDALGVLAFSAVEVALLAGVQSTSRNLRMHKGIQALRQAAVSGDSRLTPLHSVKESGDPVSQETPGSSQVPLRLDPLRSIHSNTGAIFSIIGLFLLLIGLVGLSFMLIGMALGLLELQRFSSFDNIIVGIYIALVGFFIIFGLLYLVIGFQWQRAFAIVATQERFEWPVLAFRGLARRLVHAPWRDARAFITFKVRRDSKSPDMGEVFLLDTTTEALTWRITPKTPASVREAHERFVHMANEHIQLRDITVSLKNLLEVPETRSFEYAVTALSGPAPVPPAVRKVLTTPVRESHFLRVYLIVAAIMLALLVAAGLLLQSGIIPPVPF